MSWVYLFFGVIAEVLGATAMKMSRGFTLLVPSVCIFLFYGLSLILVTSSLKSIDVGIAYAIWAGLGVAIISLISIVYFNESFSVIKMVSIIFIIIGVVGLNFSDKKEDSATIMNKYYVKQPDT